MHADFAGLSFVYEAGGVWLPQLGLWLDSAARQSGPEQVFVSHGHADHLGRHREVLLTEPTSWFMHTRLSGKRTEQILTYHEAREFGPKETRYRLTLLPAGHVLGSAMAQIEVGGITVLYTGDFKLQPSLAAEPCKPAKADVLIMETTFGRPVYRFPTPDQLQSPIRDFCEQALRQDSVPVLLGYSLGKSQEIMMLLRDTGFKLMLHEQVAKLTHIYQHFGSSFPQYEKMDPGQARGKVIIAPPQVQNTARLQPLGSVRTALFTGWALNPGWRYRCHVDEAFPLSDHADFEQLLEMVRRVGPKKILTLHGFAADFAQALRDRGYDAQALSEEDQLSLPLTPGI